MFLNNKNNKIRLVQTEEQSLRNNKLLVYFILWTRWPIISWSKKKKKLHKKVFFFKFNFWNLEIYFKNTIH